MTIPQLPADVWAHWRHAETQRRRYKVPGCQCHVCGIMPHALAVEQLVFEADLLLAGKRNGLRPEQRKADLRNATMRLGEEVAAR